jgi:dihydroflavonol-4-reductase
MIIAVTGATEHIGMNLVHALAAKRHEVRALIPGDSHTIRNLGVKTIKGDVRDSLSLSRAFSGAEVVYHVSQLVSNSSSDWPILEAINITGTRNVIEACLQCEVKRLVHFSTVRALIQGPLNLPLNERQQLAESEDCQPYDRSRAAAEREIRKGLELGLDAVLLVPTGVIGPFDYQPSQIGEILLALGQGKLTALVQEGFDWVDARDVVQAALRAAEVAPTGAKYLLSGAWVSFPDLARLIQDLTGKGAPRLVVPAWMARTGAPMITAFNQATRQRLSVPNLPFTDLGSCNPAVSSERAAKELNYRPRPLVQTLADTFKWYQEAGLFNRSIRLKT